MSTVPNQTGQRPHLILCGCGPGEIAAWAFPLLDALKRLGQGWRVSLVLWPRLFPSGREAQVARQSEGFDAVLGPAESRGLLMGGPLPPELQGVSPSLVLHLAGPSLFSLLLGRRLRCRVVAYVEKRPSLAHRFSGIYCADEESCVDIVRRGAPPGGVRPVGNLMVDSVQELRMRRSHRHGGEPQQHESMTIAILPGSRGVQLRNSICHILPSVEAVNAKIPQVRCLIAKSPFLSLDGFERALAQAREAGLCDRDTRLSRTAEGAVLEGGDGVTVPIVERDEALLRADMLITSPGTNTAEAAALGIPMVVVAPYGPHTRVFWGPANVLERLPWINAAVKRVALALLRRGMRYYSHANNRAGREIVPEIQGPIDSRKIADTLAEFANDRIRRERMRSELEGLLGPPGAAERLVNELDAWFQAPAEQD